MRTAVVGTLRDRADAVRDALRDPARLGLEGLHRSGRGWTGLCPLHPDREPSFSVLEHADGIGWTCFAGCGSGDVLGLLARQHGLDTCGSDFRRVVELGEQIAGIGSKAPKASVAPPRRPAPRPEPPRLPPPELEVLALWEAGLPVCDDPETVAWLEGRGLVPDRVEERNLARVLPLGIALPRWAWGPGGAWTSSGHRLLVLTYDEHGKAVSMQARRFGGDDPKSLWPAGHRAAGVFADPLARWLLLEGAAPDWWNPRKVLLAEGVPDFLTWATIYGDDESCPAVFGFAAGGWTQAIADRLPTGCEVVLASHNDQAGEKYSDEITPTLEGRCEVVEVDHGA